MDFEVIKAAAIKHSFLPFQVKEQELIIFRQLDLLDFIRCCIKNKIVHCHGYHASESPNTPTFRKEGSNVEDINKILQYFKQIKYCQGFPETLLKPGTEVSEIIIRASNSKSDDINEYLIRSRNCNTLLDSGESICTNCKNLTIKKDENKSKYQENQCTFCHQNISNKLNLIKHIREHHEQAFKCSWDMCNKHFGSEADLDLHMKRHLQEFNFYCDLCNKGFVTVRELKNHKICHQNLRTFVCSVCGKLFLRKTNLTEHMNIHTDVKQYSCNICNLSFSRSNNLLTHKIRMHGLREKKFECTSCDKKFHAQQQLTRHLAVHTGIKPFSCNHCSASFSRKDRLRSHIMKTHKIGLLINSDA